MYNRRRTGTSIPRILVPTLLVVLFGAIGLFDYDQQHVKLTMLGSTFNVSAIDQVLLEPYEISDGLNGEYTISDRSSIVQLCKLIASAKLYHGSGSAFATDADELLLQSSDETTQIQLSLIHI